MTISPPPHGGRLREAARHFDRPLADWLDLSTGINPCSYPLPPLDVDVWRRLPDDDDELPVIAARYYGVPATARVLAVAGSQAAIRTLPRLLPPGRIGIAPLTYSEYAPAWRRAGHEVVPVDLDGIEAALPTLDVLLVVNPNNPTTERVAPGTLLRWHETLAARGGLLLVDEAFMDASPAHSIAAHTGAPGLLVCRSVGKFFGLAGLRAGFALGEPALVDRLAAELGAWAVSGPARAVVATALADTDWQQAMRDRLQRQQSRLVALLAHHGLKAVSTPLFCWCPHPDAPALYHALAQQGILVRCFPALGGHGPSLRFGLPDDDSWARLDAGLAHAFSTPGAGAAPLTQG